MRVAPEGLLTDHMSKGSLIAAIGWTIEDYRLSHKETTMVYHVVHNINFYNQKNRTHGFRLGTPTYHFGITWVVSQDHCCSSVITIRKLNRKLYIGDYRLTIGSYISEAIGYINRIETIGD